MYSFNNTMHSKQQQKQPQLNKQVPYWNCFDFSGLESEMKTCFPVNDDYSFNMNQNFRPNLYASNEVVWSPLTVNTNTYSSITKTETTKTISEPVKIENNFRAIIKNSTITTKKTSMTDSVYQAKNLPEYKPKQDEQTCKPVVENEKTKNVDKIYNISSPASSNLTRKLPLRSKNIDLSQYLVKNKDLLSTSCGSICSSSADTTLSSISESFSPNSEKSEIIKETNNGKSSSSQFKCSFCKNNGEKEEIYTSHPLKDSLSRIVCPILRNFACPKCGESGDYAHTNNYCPVTQRKRKENKIKTVLSDC